METKPKLMKPAKKEIPKPVEPEQVEEQPQEQHKKIEPLLFDGDTPYYNLNIILDALDRLTLTEGARLNEDPLDILVNRIEGFRQYLSGELKKAKE